MFYVHNEKNRYTSRPLVSEAAAEEVARKLARAHPGQVFRVLKAVSTSSLEATTTRL